ncbi:conserved hypothetical protein [Desulfamplus magnetovallimortis]|uniref:Transcriptional regulator n=1 Tax=Desulfamplus magnetovallimortis TaxID=1246637 RepID=A0A1W1HJ29_9BACT|nr:hypothetical protein [Desulfamplus magnetovallimortis]SLM32415.1 conserved hypothetical protein [Desulfamplus magnetovallimortis]
MKKVIQLPAEFDYNLLIQALEGYKKPRDKIRGLISSGEILRVKKGIYVLGKHYGKPYNKFILANLIYGPSYITGQTALAFWNMIPERVELVISLTTKRKKIFETPVGRFSYVVGPEKVFGLGVRLEDAGSRKNILIASPEKALCDLAAMQPNIITQKAMREFLGLMRLDDHFHNALDFTLMKEIRDGYRRKNVKLLLDCLERSDV